MCNHIPRLFYTLECWFRMTKIQKDLIITKTRDVEINAQPRSRVSGSRNVILFPGPIPRSSGWWLPESSSAGKSGEVRQVDPLCCAEPTSTWRAVGFPQIGLRSDTGI